jgi:DNA ligase D-like protein (predicted 3'-phosphoesterase)
MGLSDYRRKRAGTSPEQPRRRRGGNSGPQFVIQHHAARSDHYEFQLEIDGVLVSWAIPRGPSVNPQDRRMARRTDDHPLEHADAQETIAGGDDGTGNVTVWDQGTYANRTKYAMVKCLGRGHLSFRLDGEKLSGGYALTRVREGDDETWLLVKRHDDQADARNRPHRPQ